MDFKNWFGRRTPLQSALKRGLRRGGDLEAELKRLGYFRLTSRADAESFCDGLEHILSGDSQAGGKTSAHSLLRLYLGVDRSGGFAFSVMARRGSALLARIVEEALRDQSRFDEETVLYSLRMLAVYETAAGTDLVIRAALLPYRPDEFLWRSILGSYTPAHPESERFFDAMRETLPTGALGVHLLDQANAAALQGVSWTHPYDSGSGRKQLESWLSDKDEARFPLAVPAAVALLFLRSPDPLLSRALEHESVDVRLEAAWVAAKLGRDDGVDSLARACLDVNLSSRAKDYLSEAGRADAIPSQAEEADFVAMAEFASWLAHPMELGRPADELEILDRRELSWPPDHEPTWMWLVRYRVKDKTGLAEDEVGVGLVGSTTFCLFSDKLEERPPEDCYAIHCYWEMSGLGLIEENEVEGESSEYDQMLRGCPVAGSSEARIILVSELAPDLGYPRRLVALAKGNRRDEAGWIVIDGPRSRWYAATEMPEDVDDKTVIMVHVGRVLLGFEEEPERRRYLRSAGSPRAPEQIVEAYERLIDAARTDPKQAAKLLGESKSVLKSAFAKYTAARSSILSLPMPLCICDAYEALLAACEQTESSSKGDFLSTSSPLGEHFDTYVDAMIELGRQSDVPALIERFRRHWDHNLGCGRLGAAAFRSGHDRIAEQFFLQLRDSYEGWSRGEEVGLLAAIWKKLGRFEDAHSLLVDAMRALQEESRSDAGSGHEALERWFQGHRAAYLALFPEHGEPGLRRIGIASTLTVS
ncbi:MAG: hypothetical protein SFX72_06100 [Isosphaeraceae bacterium]|nr:hypothetical protein [Isosphaeraceae bacterium]